MNAKLWVKVLLVVCSLLTGLNIWTIQKLQARRDGEFDAEIYLFDEEHEHEKIKQEYEMLDRGNYNYNKANVLCKETNSNTKSMEAKFNESLAILNELKVRNYIPTMNCPDFVPKGWRHSEHIPHIMGNECEPWWAKDAVFLMARLLNRKMNVIEYGTGVSTLWFSMFVRKIVSTEISAEWTDFIANMSSMMNISNIIVRKHYFGVKYVEPELELFEDPEINEKGIDVFAIDGGIRIYCVEYAVKKIKQNGGILLLDNSDRPSTINATDLVPKHWMRYDSVWMNHHTKGVNPRWLRNARTTIWITREP